MATAFLPSLSKGWKQFNSWIQRFFNWAEQHPLVLVCIIAVTHLILKSINLTGPSIWFDESATLFASQRDIGEIIARAQNDQNPPAYYILLHFWIQLWGMGELSVRLFSVFSSVGTAILLFLFNKKFFNIRTAIFVSLLFLFSPLWLYFSKEIRNYAFSSFLVMGSYYLFFSLIKSPNWKYLIGLGLINGLIFYTHFTTALIFPAQFIASLLLIRSNLKGFKFYVGSQVLGAALTVPWLPYMFQNMPEDNVHWRQFATPFDYWFALRSYVTNDDITRKVLIFLGVALVLFIFFRKKARDQHHPLHWLILAGFYLIPITAMYFIGSYLTPAFAPRYTLPSSIGFILLLGYCLANIPVANVFRIALLVFLLIKFGNRLDVNASQEEHWKPLVAAAKEEITPNSLLLFSAPHVTLPFYYYYDQEVFGHYNGFYEHLATINAHGVADSSSFNGKNIDSTRFDRIVLIQGHEGTVDPNNTLLAKLLKDYTLKTYKNFGPKLSVFSVKQGGKTEAQELTNGFEEGLLPLNDSAQWNTATVASGSRSMQVDQDHSIGYVFRESYRNFNQKSLIILYFKLWQKESSGSPVITTRMLGDEGIYANHNHQIKHLTKQTENWTDVKVYYDIPSTAKPDDILEIIMNNPTASPMYVDDFRMLVY